MLQRAAPLLFTILGGLCIGGIGLFRIWNDPKSPMLYAIALFALTYVGWMFFESRVTRGELEREQAPADKSTMELAAVIKIFMLASFFVVAADPYIERCIIGFVVAWIGILLRAWAIVTLGKEYSHRIRIPAEIKSNGPYRWIRHPAYLGTFLAHAGFVFVFLNNYSAFMLFLWAVVVWIRVRVEEKFFANHDPYQIYSRVVRFNIIPFLW